MAPRTTITLKLRGGDEYYDATDGNRIDEDAPNAAQRDLRSGELRETALSKTNTHEDGDPHSYLIVSTSIDNWSRVEQFLTDIHNYIVAAAAINWDTVGDFAIGRVYELYGDALTMVDSFHEQEPQQGEHIASQIHVMYNIPVVASLNRMYDSDLDDDNQNAPPIETGS